MEQFVLTVLGPVAPGDLGITLPHEHLLIDASCWWQEPAAASKKRVAFGTVELARLGEIRRDPLLCKDNCYLTDLDLAIQEVTKFKRAGGGAVVDLTNVGLGRDPVALAEIARETGLHLVMGSGYYVAASHPPDMDTRSVEQITDEITTDIDEGVCQTRVRAGIIGELGTGSPITPNEEKELRAGARAHRRTRAHINVHPFGWAREALRALDTLEEEGADLSHVAISPISPRLYDVPYQEAIASRGAYLGYDFFGQDFYFDSWGLWVPKDTECISAIATLVARGHLDRILLSHDVYTKIQLTQYGGWGYAHLLTHLPRYVRKAGIDDEQLRMMLVDNPKRLLTFTKTS